MHDTAERIRNGLSNAWESESGQIISRLEHTFPARVNVNKSRRKVLIFKIYNKHPCTMCDESFAFSSKLAIHISPYRFWPTFEFFNAQKTSGADRLGEPKNQISEL